MNMDYRQVPAITLAVLVILLGDPMGDAVIAHEGHQPLPSKGVLVNTRSGKITLTAQAREAIGLRSEEVVVGTVRSELSLYAETVPAWEARAFGSARISGRITKLLANPGDGVTAGQVIAELSSRELEAVTLEYLQAEKDLALNAKLLEITRPTALAGAVPMQRLLDLETSHAQAENRLEIARIRARTLDINLEPSSKVEPGEARYLIRSPIAGRVVHSDLSEGKYVEAFEHLFEIVNTDHVWVRLQVLEKDFYRVAVGQGVRLELPNLNSAIEGSIDRLDVGLDPQTQTGWAWMTVAHPDIVPGVVGRAKVRISSGDEKITVPRGAIHSDGLQPYVLVEEASTRVSAEYRKRYVKLGDRISEKRWASGPMVEIVDGEVYPGDRVVVAGGHGLSSLLFLEVLKLSAADRRRMGLATTIAARRPIAETVELPATVILPPKNRSVLSSQLDGTIHRNLLSPGREVVAGEVLIEIASTEFHTMQLDLLTTVLEADLSRRRAERLEALRGDAVSLRVALETRARAEQLEIRVESLKRKLSTLGLTADAIASIVSDRKVLEYLPIRSAIGGRVATSTASIGETVAANQPLGEIQNVEEVWIEGRLPSAFGNALSPGDQGVATVIANPDIRVPVSMSRVGPVVDDTTRTRRVWLEPKPAAGRPRLWPGTLTTVVVTTSMGVETLAVPSSAVLRDGIRLTAFVLKAGGRVERRRLEIGRSDGEFTEVLAGLVAGEEVVSSGGRELQTAYASLR
jgi:RND family efflux transporter MFP subunit